MMTDELILHLWEAFVGDTTLTARPLNDDDKIAFANAVLNAAKESDARRREKSATHEPVTFTPWDSLPWKPKPIGFAQRSDIELYAKVLTIRPPDAKHDVALFTRDQLQRAVSAALKEFEGMHWVDLDKALAAPASAGVEEFPLPEAHETAEPRKETQSVQTSGSFTARDGVLLYGLRLTFDEWQAKHGPNGGAYDIEQQRAGWNGALASLVAAPEARETAEPALDLDCLKEQANAWLMVCQTLNEVAPCWVEGSLNGQDSACAAIRRLAAQPAVEKAEPALWQWRRKRDPWTLEHTYNTPVIATTDDSEVRMLYAAPSTAARETAGPAFATDRSFGWCPDQCPITRLPFFMWIQHPRDGWVPTYGGPLDSYTIPVMGGLPTEPFHERPLERERFDHDAGYWVDGVEEIPLRVAHDDALAAPVPQAEPSTFPGLKRTQIGGGAIGNNCLLLEFDCFESAAKTCKAIDAARTEGKT